MNGSAGVFHANGTPEWITIKFRSPLVADGAAETRTGCWVPCKLPGPSFWQGSQLPKPKSIGCP